MATVAVRLTLKFNFSQILRAAGWSESYDLGYGSLASAVTNLQFIQAFITDRVNLLGVGPVLVEAVLSAYVQPLAPGAPPVRRSTVSLTLPAPPGATGAYNPKFNNILFPNTYQADFAPTVLYVELVSDLAVSPVYRRTVWLAGLPDLGDQTDSAAVLDANVQAALNKFRLDLQNSAKGSGGLNNVSIRSIDRSGGNPVKACSAWDLVLNQYTVPAHGFAANQPIIAEGMTTIKGGTAPRGRYLVKTVIDANTISLQGSGPPTAPVHTGGFRAAIYTFTLVQIATSQGFTKRNKGRPSSLSVGRRRKPATSRA